MKSLLRSVIIIASIFNFGNVCGAAEIASFKTCSDVWGVVGEYCDVQTLTTLVQVSSRVGIDPQRQLHDIKKWQDEGGLLITMFGNPTEEDLENYYRLRRAEAVPLRMSADEIKRVLLSFAHIADLDVVAELSDEVERYIEVRYDLSARAKYQLKKLLPNSQNRFMSQLLSDRDDIGDWLDGDSLGFSSADRQKIFIRILKQPRELSEYSSEIHYMLSYLFRTMEVNKRYAYAYIISCLVVKDLSLSDLCILQVYSQFFGYWDEADIAMNRMMEHPEMNKWLKIYFVLIAKPWTDNVIKPVMQYYTTLSWLGRKAVKALKG